jgi:hypothetical protein
LLDAGVPIDGLDQDGHTPLQEAGAYYRTQMATLLLERGADPSVLEALDEGERAALRKGMGAKWATLVQKKKATSKKQATSKKKASKR